MEEDIFDRKEHGFKNMEVGEILSFTGDDMGKIQVYAHVYGRQSKKKFKTKTKNGVLYIKRVQ